MRVCIASGKLGKYMIQHALDRAHKSTGRASTRAGSGRR
jgi:putative NADH-flavin reductase